MNHLLTQLQQLEAQRQQIRTLEEGLQQLSPEERLILQKLIILPERGNVALLCQLLNVEECTVYRRKQKALERLAAYLS